MMAPKPAAAQPQHAGSPAPAPQFLAAAGAQAPARDARGAQGGGVDRIALAMKWARARAKLLGVGRRALNRHESCFAHAVLAASANKNRLLSPGDAAQGLVEALSIAPIDRDAEFFQALVAFGRYVKVPLLNSNMRTVLVWLKCLKSLELVRAEEGEELFRPGGVAKGRALYLLSGRARQTGEDGQVTIAQTWAPLGLETLLGEPYRGSCVAVEPCRLAALDRSAFEAARAEVADLPPEALRLNELLLKPPGTRSPRDLEELVSRLKSVRFFADLRPSICARVATALEMFPAWKGSVLFRPGSPVTRFLLLLKGSVALSSCYVVANDPVHRVVRAGELIRSSTKAALVVPKERSCFATCLEDCEIVFLPKVVYDKMVEAELAADAAQRLDAMRRVPWLADVPAPALQRALLQSRVALEAFGPQALICAQSQSLDRVGWVAAGEASLQCKTAPHEASVPVLTVGPGDLLLGAAMLRGEEPFRAVAVTGVRILWMACELLHELLPAEKLVAISEEVAARYAALEQRAAGALTAQSAVKQEMRNEALGDRPKDVRAEVAMVGRAALSLQLGLDSSAMTASSPRLGVFQSLAPTFMSSLAPPSEQTAVQQMQSLMKYVVDPMRAPTPPAGLPRGRPPRVHSFGRRGGSPHAVSHAHLPRPGALAGAAEQACATAQRPHSPSDDAHAGEAATTRVEPMVGTPISPDHLGFASSDAATETEVPGPLHSSRRSNTPAAAAPPAPRITPRDPAQSQRSGPVATDCHRDDAGVSEPAARGDGGDECSVDMPEDLLRQVSLVGRDPEAALPLIRQQQRAHPRRLNPSVLALVDVRRPESRSTSRKAAHRGTMVLSCGRDRNGSVDLDAAAPESVALLPNMVHETIDQLFRSQAQAHICKIKSQRDGAARRLPGHVAVKRFGLTDDEKYRQAERSALVNYLLSLDDAHLARRLVTLRSHDPEAAKAAEDALNRRRQAAGGVRGIQLFRQAAKMFKVSQGLVERTELTLPLEVDSHAPALEHKMRYPTLLDVHYILARWQHRWQVERETVWREVSGDSTLSGSLSGCIRPLDQIGLYGYPHDGSKAVRQSSRHPSCGVGAAGRRPSATRKPK